MQLICFLILFPLIVGIILLLIRSPKLSNPIVLFGAVGVFIATVSLLLSTFRLPAVYFASPTPLIDKAMLVIEIILGIFILYLCVKSRNILSGILITAQVILISGFEIFFGHQETVTHALFIDKLSVLMTAVIGIIGSLICVYASGYMKDFHEVYHKEIGDRRNVFFFLTFLFLSAMFGIVFSNNLLWIYFFWEITTLCSFLLIGYKKTEESTKSAFHALKMNLIGGLAFAVGIIWLYHSFQIIELDKVLALNKFAVLVPVALICIAGLTKSAQYPFSSWLLGAMVAPTPVSALLHSSTMVKAGVYIILRFATVLEGTACGFVIALIGGLTFVIASFAAISQRDAKKVLAYSTIANLGLIVLCCGVGTYEAVWAAMLLIIFHAVAKCLLFLCVGVVEHKLHSRNIDNMSGLIISMPKVSIMMQIGMAGMFLAPFGMLISKWAALKAIVDSNPTLLVFIVFGGAATLFFWVKWIGTLIMVFRPLKNVEEGTHKTEWLALATLSGLTIGACAFFPVVSAWFVQPYVVELYGRTIQMSQGNVVIMLIMLAMVMLFPLSFINYGKNVKVTDAYLGGANIDSSVRFRGAVGSDYDMELKSYYLDNYFNEARLMKVGVAVSSILLVVLILIAIR